MKALTLLALCALGFSQSTPSPSHNAAKGTPITDCVVVLNKTDNTAMFLEAESGAPLLLLNTGEGPHEVAVSPDGQFAVVADYGHQTPGNTLSLIQLSKQRVTRKIDLGPYQRPHGLAFLDEDRLLVTAEVQKALIEVDLESGKVLRSLPTDQGASHMVAVSPDAARAYVANIASGSVTAIDLEQGERIANIPTGEGCEGVDVSPDGAEIWTSDRSANTVSIIDADSLKVVAQLETASFPIRVKFTPNGKKALVSCANDGVLAVFDTETRELIAEIPMEWKATEGTSKRLFQGFGDSPAPVGILVHPEGKLAYVANSNANLVAVIDLEALEVIDAWPVGNQPDGLAWARI